MTERQAAILVAIIEQYAEVAVPVGSVTLAKLFGVSSATIRSEMARLEELDMIHQPHTSAGRVPTDKGYRFYVNRLTETENNDIPRIDRSARAIEARVQTHVDRAQRLRCRQHHDAQPAVAQRFDRDLLAHQEGVVHAGRVAQTKRHRQRRLQLMRLKHRLILLRQTIRQIEVL